MATLLHKYTIALIKFFISYPALIAVALLTTIILSPFFMGTNTGQTAYVYTSLAYKGIYVKDGGDFIKYDPSAHGSDAKIYVTNGSGYYRNKANWRFMDPPCRLTETSLIIGGILLRWVFFVWSCTNH